MSLRRSYRLVLLLALSGCLSKSDLPLAVGTNEPIQTEPTPHPSVSPPFPSPPSVGTPARWMPEQVLLTLEGTFRVTSADTNFASSRVEWNQISGGSAPFADGGPEGDLNLGVSIFAARAGASVGAFDPDNSETNGFCDAAVRGIAPSATRSNKIRDLSLLLLGESLSPEEVLELEALIDLGLAPGGGFQREHDVICTVLVNHPRFLTY